MTMEPGNTRILHLERDHEGAVIVSEQNGIISLSFGDTAAQTAIDTTAPERLVFGYFPAMLAGLMACPRPARVLCLGLGGGALVRYLLERLPQVVIDAVEPRPLVTRLAHEFLMLPRSKRLFVHHMSGYAFLQENPACYDTILVDIFDAQGMAAELFLPEFALLLRRRLHAGGSAALNLWNSDRKKFQGIKKLAQNALGPMATLAISARSNVVLLGFRPPYLSLSMLLANAEVLESELQLPGFSRFFWQCCMKNPLFLLKWILIRYLNIEGHAE